MSRLGVAAMFVAGSGAIAADLTLGLSPDMPETIEGGIAAFVDAANADKDSTTVAVGPDKPKNARQAFALLKAERLDLATVPTDVVAGTVPEFMIFKAGFLFAGPQDLLRIWRNEACEQTWNRRLIELAGVRVIEIFPDGARHLVIGEKRIQGVADLADLRIRTLPNPMSAAVTLAAKAHPVPVSERFLISELKDGGIDAFEMSLAELSAMTDLPDLTVLASGHQFDSFALLVRETLWQGLPEDRRAAWMRAATQASDALAASADAHEAGLRKSLEERGVAFSRLPPADKKQWVAEVRKRAWHELGRRLGRDHPTLKLFEAD